MTAIAAELCTRALPHPAADDHTLSLAAQRRGSSAVVVGYSDRIDASAARRLFDLGFAPGTVVDVVRRAPLADPVIFRVAGCEVALRKALAREILVDPK